MTHSVGPNIYLVSIPRSELQQSHLDPMEFCFRYQHPHKGRVPLDVYLQASG